MTDDLTDLRVKLDAIYDASARVRRAEGERDTAVESATEALERAASGLVAKGEKLPITLIRELYWRLLDIPVDTIADVFEYGAAHLHKLVGPLKVERPCADCGTETVSHVMKNRSELYAPRDYLDGDPPHGRVRITGRQVWTCSRCREEILEKALVDHAAWAAESDRRNREFRAAVARAEATGNFEETVVRWSPLTGGQWIADDQRTKG